MEDYNSLNENFNTKLDAWINDIKDKGCKTVIYSLSDINYKLRFDEMINTFNIPKPKVGGPQKSFANRKFGT